MSYEYVKEYYNVPAEIGRRIGYKGRKGTIYKDGDNYIAVNFDDMRPGRTLNIYPADPDLVYLGIGALRNMTRSQRRYQKYLDQDSGLTFIEWLCINK